MIPLNENKITEGVLVSTGVLTGILTTLKLTGVISWSWLWVLAPLWIPVALLAVFLIAVGLLAYYITDLMN